MNNSSNDTSISNNTYTPIVYDDRHPEYLWLLALDLIVFLFLTYLSYSSSKKEQKKPLNQMQFEDFKATFIQVLVISNGARAFSLLIIMLMANDTGDSPSAWLTYVAHAIPAFCFVSAYMCLIIFFADTYFSFASYNNHLIKPALFILAISCYIIITLMALITFGKNIKINFSAFGKYKAFGYASEFLIGLVYLIIGVLTIYYGQQVSYVFETKAHDDYEGNKETSRKVHKSLFFICLVVIYVNVYWDTVFD